MRAAAHPDALERAACGPFRRTHARAAFSPIRGTPPPLPTWGPRPLLPPPRPSSPPFPSLLRRLDDGGSASPLLARILLFELTRIIRVRLNSGNMPPESQPDPESEQGERRSGDEGKTRSRWRRSDPRHQRWRRSDLPPPTPSSSSAPPPVRSAGGPLSVSDSDNDSDLAWARQSGVTRIGAGRARARRSGPARRHAWLCVVAGR